MYPRHNRQGPIRRRPVAFAPPIKLEEEILKFPIHARLLQHQLKATLYLTWIVSGARSRMGTRLGRPGTARSRKELPGSLRLERRRPAHHAAMPHGSSVCLPLVGGVYVTFSDGSGPP